MVLPKMAKHLWSYHLLGPSHSCVNAGLLLSATQGHAGTDAELVSGHCQKQQLLHHLPDTVGYRNEQSGPSAPCHPFCVSPLQGISTNNPSNRAWQTPTLPMLLKARSWFRWCSLHYLCSRNGWERQGSLQDKAAEAALGLHWRYFASDAPSCCCTWKPRGAALSVLNELGCSSVPAEIMLRVTLVNVCFFPVCSLNLSIVLLFHLTTGWARHFVSDWRHGQIGQRKKA